VSARKRIELYVGVPYVAKPIAETESASARLKELQKKFGFEPDRVVLTAKELLVRVE